MKFNEGRTWWYILNNLSKWVGENLDKLNNKVIDLETCKTNIYEQIENIQQLIDVDIPLYAPNSYEGEK